MSLENGLSWPLGGASWAPGLCGGAAKQWGLGSSHTLRGVSWAGADWCLNRILAAGEGSIAGDWEDSCWKTGPPPPPALAVSLPSSTPIPAIGKPSPRDSTSREKGPTSQPGLWGQGGSTGLGQFVGWRGSTADRWQHARGSGPSREGRQMAPPGEAQGPWNLSIWRGCVPAVPRGWQGR